MASRTKVERGLVLAAVMLWSGHAAAATIYGSLKQAERPVADAAVQLTCGKVKSAGQTNAMGNYSLSIAASGDCTLSVDGKAGAVSLGSNPVRYDFEVPASGASLIQR